MTGKKTIASSCIYYFAIAIYVVAWNMQLSYAYNIWAVSGSFMLKVLQFLRYASYGLCFCRLLLLRRINQCFLWIAIILLFGAIVASLTGTANSPIFYFFFFAAGINTNFKKIIKVFLLVQFSTFVLYIVCGLTGLTGEETIVQTGRTRAFLGYGWVNRASYCLLFMTIESIYLRNFKLRFLPAMTILAANIFIYIMTRTAFSMMLTVAIVLSGLYREYIKRNRWIFYPKEERRLTTFFLIMLIAELVLPFIYDPNNSTWQLINHAVTGRLELAQKAINQYGLHIWGNKIEWVGSSTLLFGLSESQEYFYVDAGFLNMALEFGLLFTGAIAVLYFMGIRLACKRFDRAMNICLFFLFILFVFEPYVIDFAFNPFPLYFISGIKIYNKQKSKDQEMNCINCLLTYGKIQEQ